VNAGLPNKIDRRLRVGAVGDDRCLTRLLTSEAGEMWVAGHPMHRLEQWQLARARRDVGHGFQQFNLVRRLSALDNAVAGRLPSAPLWRVIARRFSADRTAAAAALERVGLAGRMEQRADRLSGGQQQRVAIARALVQGSRVLLAEEPVASLNPETAASVLGLLREISRERGMTVLCSLHQPELARALRGPSDPLPELGTRIWSMMPRRERRAGKLHSTVSRNHLSALESWGRPPSTTP
jgi:phosphonate transport system ATP-binding protein